MSEIEGQVIDEPLSADQQARRRLAIAQIRQYPDAALRLKAKPVEKFDDDLRRLVERMTTLMHEAHGVGLAATQVGTLKRLFVFQPDPEEDALVVINPEITVRGDETDVDDEGCLSLQGVTVPVERVVKLTLSARDPDGKEIRHELEGHAARIAQHELDHLDGVLIIDRTTPEARREALATLRPRIILT